MSGGLDRPAEPERRELHHPLADLVGDQPRFRAMAERDWVLARPTSDDVATCVGCGRTIFRTNVDGNWHHPGGMASTAEDDHPAQPVDDPRSTPCRHCSSPGVADGWHIYGQRKCCPDCDHRPVEAAP